MKRDAENTLAAWFLLAAVAFALETLFLLYAANTVHRQLLREEACVHYSVTCN